MERNPSFGITHRWTTNILRGGLEEGKTAVKTFTSDTEARSSTVWYVNEQHMTFSRPLGITKAGKGYEC
jgi:hypothetical protein